MKRIVLLLTVLLLVLCQVCALQAAVSITQANGQYKVHAAAYDATVAPDGCLTNLAVDGVEFLKPGVDNSRGSFYIQNGVLKLPDVRVTGENSISATGDLAEITYTFSDTGMVWALKNKAGSCMSFLLAIDPAIKFVKVGGDQFRSTPLSATGAETSWIVGKKKIDIKGSSKLWGPWSAGLQMWESDLDGGESKTAVFSFANASPSEAKAVQNVQLGMPADYDGFLLISPSNARVFQRQSRYAGRVLVSGKTDVACDAIEYRIVGKPLKGTISGKWQRLAFDPVGRRFNKEISVPAGGWYSFDIRGLKSGKVVTSKHIEKFGVGEVFVGAGQSNSTNNGQFATKQQSGMVSCFSGNSWEVRDDPFVGAHDGSGGGSYYPAFGDAMYAKYHVPIGIASTGNGGTTVAEWDTGGTLYNWMMTRIRQLGPGGFRAVLWHQGESDAKTPSEKYYTGMAKIINDSNSDAGWSFPWFVAHVSYCFPENPSSTLVRTGQQMLWDKAVALQGPDTDTLVGDMRDRDGKGAHFSPKGLSAHGKMWADIVGKYLDSVLGK